MIHTAEQQDLASSVRGLLAKHANVRTAIESETGYDAELWRILCNQIGVAALAIPEELGGIGVGAVESHLVLEELGKLLVPTPMLGSVVLAAQTLLAIGDDETNARLLPAIAEGTSIAALCWASESGWDDIGVSFDGELLSGAAHYVLDGAHSDVLVVVAQCGDEITDGVDVGACVGPEEMLWVEFDNARGAVCRSRIRSETRQILRRHRPQQKRCARACAVGHHRLAALDCGVDDLAQTRRLRRGKVGLDDHDPSMQRPHGSSLRGAERVGRVQVACDVAGLVDDVCRELLGPLADPVVRGHDDDVANSCFVQGADGVREHGEHEGARIGPQALALCGGELDQGRLGSLNPCGVAHGGDQTRFGVAESLDREDRDHAAERALVAGVVAVLTAIGGSRSVGGHASSLVRMTAYTREGHVDMMTHAGERVWMPGVLGAAGS